jgi:hypothetical protein
MFVVVWIRKNIDSIERKKERNNEKYTKVL